MLRTVSRLLFLLFAIGGAGQTAPYFTARYGYPDAEKFLARPEITLTTKYADDQACEMLIEPRSSEQRQSTKEPSMATAVVFDIIEELIPGWQRGTLLGHGIESMGAAEHQVFEYQNVTITRDFTRYLPANHDETSATIVRKDQMCRSSKGSQEFVPDIKLTASDLRVRYGDPIAQRFKIRSDVPLMVTYGHDQTACEISVDSARSIIPRDEPTEYIRPEVMTEIIDEISPEADRRKLLSRVVFVSSCNEYETQDYETVTILRFRHNCLLPNPEIEGIATIRFKNPSCGNGLQ